MKGLSLGKIISPSLSIPQLPIVLYLSLRPYDVLLFYVTGFISALIVQISFRQSYWWYFMGIASLITRRYNFTEKSYSSESFNLSISSSAICCRCSQDWEPYNLLKSTFWSVVVFCKNFNLLQWKVSVMKGVVVWIGVAPIDSVFECLACRKWYY